VLSGPGPGLNRQFAAVALLCAAVAGLFAGMALGVFGNRRGAAATAGTAAAGSVQPSPPPAPSPSPSPSPSPTTDPGPPRGVAYVITNAADGLALDVKEEGKDDGTPVIAFPRHGRANQQWNLIDAGHGYVILTSVDSGKCLQVEDLSRDEGAAAVQEDCTGAPDQQWRLAAAGGGWALVSHRSGLALGESGEPGDSEDGLVPVSQQRRSGSGSGEGSGTGQAWLFTPARG
jgi:hypothetical protein